MNLSKKLTKIEREFDKKFVVKDKRIYLFLNFIDDSVKIKTIKSFYRSKIKKIVLEIMRMLEEKKVSCSGSCGAGCEYQVEKIINSLKEYRK